MQVKKTLIRSQTNVGRPVIHEPIQGWGRGSNSGAFKKHT